MTGASFLVALSLASDSGKRTENISCRPTRPACCTFYLSNLITVQCSTVQSLPAQSNRWHSMHKITMPCLASALYLPSSHLSLKNPSSITSATAQATASSMYCNLLRMEERTSKTPSKSRGACLASPSGVPVWQPHTYLFLPGHECIRGIRNSLLH
jgi:hypothetical protein